MPSPFATAGFVVWKERSRRPPKHDSRAAIRGGAHQRLNSGAPTRPSSVSTLRSPRAAETQCLLSFARASRAGTTPCRSHLSGMIIFGRCAPPAEDRCPSSRSNPRPMRSTPVVALPLFPRTSTARSSQSPPPPHCVLFVERRSSCSGRYSNAALPYSGSPRSVPSETVRRPSRAAISRRAQARDPAPDTMKSVSSA